MKKRIAQIGTFDVENYGDLLFPVVLKEKMKEFDIDLFSPNGGPKPFEENITVYPISCLKEKALENNYVAIIIGGGDLLRIDMNISLDYKNNLDTSLKIWQYPISVGTELGIPIIINALGVPFYFPNKYKDFVKMILDKVDYISVRDYSSKNILDACDVKRVEVVPDTVICINEIFSDKLLKIEREKLIKEEKIPNIEKYIIFQHNLAKIDSEDYLESVRKLLDKVINMGYKILFMPIGYVHNDINFMKKVYDEKNEKYYIINNKLSPKEMLSVISNSEGYIGTSMHGAITAFSYNKPILILNPNNLTKINGLVEILGIKKANIKVISQAFDYLEKDFFKVNVNTNRKKINSEINNHFSKIKDVINNTHKNNNYDFETELISYCVSKFDNAEEKCSELTVYFANGDGYNEKNKAIYINKAPNNKVDIKLKLDKTTTSIRIDPIENYGLKINDLKVLTKNDRVLKYNIPNLLVLENKQYILSDDPQIIVDDLEDIEEIKITFDYEILKYRNIIELSYYLCDSIESLKNEKRLYLEELNNIKNSRVWKLYENLKRNGKQK